MKISEWKTAVREKKIDGTLNLLYGSQRLVQQRERYIGILEKAEEKMGDRDVRLFSAPGRTEVGGNHTDHQLGRVLAASIDLDVVGVAAANDDMVIRYYADEFEVKPVDINDTEIHQDEINTTESLIRGIAARYAQNNHKIGGFDCYAESDVLPGSGMSSSAAFEILIAYILSNLYNDGTISPVEQAMTGQYAENKYFGKASGLMDQMACSVGGFVAIDFKDPDNPRVRNIPFELEKFGYALILTNCRQSHADLSDEYSSVPHEMKAAARVMGKHVLSECTLYDLQRYVKEIREQCGDRALLRAFHFLTETDRVVDEVAALEKGQIHQFLQYIIDSGNSSYMSLQNIYSPSDPMHQSLAIGLVMSQAMLSGKGAWRVHGGGFAGTIQAFVHLADTQSYIGQMEAIFGAGSCYQLRIRSVGGYEITL